MFDLILVHRIINGLLNPNYEDVFEFVKEDELKDTVDS